MPGPHSKLKAIGRALRAEESRFIGYMEIERKSKALGFGMTVRTLRFYVDEGILPPPKKVGKTPVYSEDWILNVLLAIHLMKTRLSRSLTEIRTILSQLQEPPEVLTDKLSVLYEDYAKAGSLKPIERAGLVDAFFDLLTGRLGRPRQASEIRLAELVDAIATHGEWDGDEWQPPAPEHVLTSQGVEPTDPEFSAAEENRLDAPAEATSQIPPTTRIKPAPDDAVTAAMGRSLEATYLRRFQANFERLGRVHCPLDDKAYKAGPKERSFINHDSTGEVIELMKRMRIYDRGLLDTMPLGGGCEYQVFQRGLFSRGDLKVVVTAISLAPVETFLEKRWATEPLGPLVVKRAIAELQRHDDVFHYVGIFSCVGWSQEAADQVPSQRNLLVALVQNTEGTNWKQHFSLDPRWAGVERVFDPETDAEKIDRVTDFLAEHLKPKGEFLIIRNLSEDLDVEPSAVQTAVDGLLANDPELSIVESSGREIIKRSRL